jgi:hypothetical protein
VIAPVELLSLAVLGLRPVHVGQIIEGHCHVGVVGSECLFLDRQRAFVGFLCLNELALLVVHAGEAVERETHVGKNQVDDRFGPS